MYHDPPQTFNSLRSNENMHEVPLQAFTGFVKVKTGLLNIYNPSKLVSCDLHKLSTGIAVIL